MKTCVFFITFFVLHKLKMKNIHSFSCVNSVNNQKSEYNEKDSSNGGYRCRIYFTVVQFVQRQ